MRSVPRWLAACAAVVLLLVACGDGDEPGSDAGGSPSPEPSETTEPSPRDSPSQEPSKDPEPKFTAEITVKGGQVRGPDKVSVKVGEEVSIAVTADVADHVHVHGYDELVDLVPGKQVVLRFTADLPGVWEVELEDAHKLLFELEVS